MAIALFSTAILLFTFKTFYYISRLNEKFLIKPALPNLQTKFDQSGNQQIKNDKLTIMVASGILFFIVHLLLLLLRETFEKVSGEMPWG